MRGQTICNKVIQKVAFLLNIHIQYPLLLYKPSWLSNYFIMIFYNGGFVQIVVSTISTDKDKITLKAENIEYYSLYLP